MILRYRCGNRASSVTKQDTFLASRLNRAVSATVPYRKVFTRPPAPGLVTATSAQSDRTERATEGQQAAERGSTAGQMQTELYSGRDG